VNKDYIRFTKEMKKDYTILIPTMLPMHLKMLSKVLSHYGYKTEVLENMGKPVIDTGLKYVHNDTCYPAILVIGQFINALQSGKYDTDKVALVFFQTGGGCRASNYVSLLRKSLKKAGLSQVPIIALSMGGIEKHPGFKLDLFKLHKMIYAVLYGDLLMCLANQVKPYEKVKGEAEKLVEKWVDILSDQLVKGRFAYKKVKENYRKIVEEFAAVEINQEEKVKVGIVGEIFVKYSPLGNNNLEKFLYEEGAEVVVPGMLDFLMYCLSNPVKDSELYGNKKVSAFVSKIGYKFLLARQRDIINVIKENGRFNPPTSFETVKSLSEGYICRGTKMGEGWLLTAEMLELAHEGVKNIICTQPFGCLPNHICGKGMMKPIKEKNPDVNIVAIDYDAGATAVNQENRIKLMLANAKK